MYREAPKKRTRVFCPNCHQFGSRARGVEIEGKTSKSSTPIALCAKCGIIEEKKHHPSLPGQGTLFPV